MNSAVNASQAPKMAPSGTNPPLWLLAELTYRCPLHCAFCYNPVDFATKTQELATADWLRVLREGRAMAPCNAVFPVANRCCVTTLRNWSLKPASSVTTPT